MNDPDSGEVASPSETCQTLKMPKVSGLLGPYDATLGERILRELASSKWDTVKVAVAFVRKSGVQLLYEALDDFGKTNNGGIYFSIGIDHGGSSIEAVYALYELTRNHERSRLWIVHNPQGNPRSTYHPKMWLFSSHDSRKRLLIVGSGNLTRGGLYTNYEASLAVVANKTDSAIRAAETFFDLVSNHKQPEVVRAKKKHLEYLHNDGQLPSEHEQNRVNLINNSYRRSTVGRKRSVPLFAGRMPPPVPSRNVAKLPSPPFKIREPGTIVPKQTTRMSSSAAAAPAPAHQFFYITIRLGNKTEVYLAKTPYDQDEAFFCGPFRGLTTPHTKGLPQPQPNPPPVVRITLHPTSLSPDKPIVLDDHPLKMWTYTHGNSANGDFRTNFTSAIQKKIHDDSVVRFERDPPGGRLQFAIDIFPPGHPKYSAMLAKCNMPLPNSTRMYGWA